MSYGRHHTTPPTLTNGQTLQWREIDASGNTMVTGGVADGDEAANVNPVLIAGADVSGLQRTVLTSSGGNLIIVGPAADGQPVSGAPVRVGGRDGSGTTQDILTTSTGLLQTEVQGSGAHAATTATAFLAISADQPAAVAATAGLRLMGFMLAEQAAATAEFRIMHGATVGGATNLYTVKLASGESTSEWMGIVGIACAAGLTIDRVSGTADVTLFTKVLA